jgi:hypothetical protein
MTLNLTGTFRWYYPPSIPLNQARDCESWQSAGRDGRTGVRCHATSAVMTITRGMAINSWPESARQCPVPRHMVDTDFIEHSHQTPAKGLRPRPNKVKAFDDVGLHLVFFLA